MSADDDDRRVLDDETIELARASAAELNRHLAGSPPSDRAHARLGGVDLVLPRQALELLGGLLAQMAQGHAVTILPRHAELTTQQAADILNVSRPHLVKLLEQGAIPYTKVRTHRRVRLQDLLAYKNERDNRGSEAPDAAARRRPG